MVAFPPQDETQALDLDAAVKRVVDNDGVGANYDPNPHPHPNPHPKPDPYPST